MKITKKQPLRPRGRSEDKRQSTKNIIRDVYINGPQKEVQIIPAKRDIAFGDYSYYNIGDRGTRSFKQLNELFAGNGMIGFVAKERVDGKLILPEAVQILKLKTE